ncbi:MAG: NAD-dependent epimerase/dehydratase family protein [Acidobacteriota bacterium]|nr:NAD-dependent epimerase/dehydratase family protein [Acidobacteriota bacterium]
MRALVTGVAGFIGSSLAEMLIARDADVIGVDCFTDYYERSIKEDNLSRLLSKSRFHFTELNLLNCNVADLLKGVTHVFHLAAQAGVRRSWGQDFSICTSLNINVTQALLDACVHQPIERFVYASSSSVYGNQVALPMREDALPRPVSPYGVTKLAGEQLCLLYHLNHDVPAVALRYFTVYGPRQRPDMAFHRFLKAAIKRRPIQLYGDGQQTRDFTFVDDIVTATVAAATAGIPGRVYNVGGGSRVSMNQVIELIATITGSSLEVDRDATQNGDMRDTYADITLARSDLGFGPTVALPDGLRAQHEWLSRYNEISS